MKNDRFLPTWSKVADALRVGRVELGQLFGDYLNWWVVELERDLGSGRLELLAL